MRKCGNVGGDGFDGQSYRQRLAEGRYQDRLADLDSVGSEYQATFRSELEEAKRIVTQAKIQAQAQGQVSSPFYLRKIASVGKDDFDGQDYISWIRQRGAEDRLPELDNLGRQLDAKFRAELEEAEALAAQDEIQAKVQTEIDSLHSTSAVGVPGNIEGIRVGAESS